MQEVQTILPKGSTIRERYIVEDLLGRGGFGAVYLVRDIRVRGNRFALKEVIDPSKVDRERFLFEGDVLKRLDHYALPRVYRAFEDDPHVRVYLLMDYIEGPNLETLRQLQPEKRFPVAQVMRMMAPIVEAVSYLHSQKPPIIHRDIKPANIIAPPGGENAVLVDFGIAKEYDQDSTTTAVRHCSPGYGAPEQYTRGTNPRTDVYGMAATFYALLTGQVPEDALYRITQLGSYGSDPLVPANQLVPEIPEFVAEALQRAMAIKSDERFATMQEFWQALHARPLPVAPDPVTPLPETHSSQASPTITDVPTVSIAKTAPPQEQLLRRRGIVLPLLALIALAALVTGIVLGAHFVSTGNHQTLPAPTRAHTATVAHRTQTPQLTATHTATSPATATPTSHPTPSSAPSPTTPAAPAGYPPLESVYNGTIHSVTLNTDDTLTLSQMQQRAGTISGYLTLGGALKGSGNFTGTVSTDRKVRFLVAPYNGNLPLLFEGQMNSDGSLSGNYCSALNNQCDNSAGYGTWRASPPSSPSSLVPGQGGEDVIALQRTPGARARHSQSNASHRKKAG